MRKFDIFNFLLEQELENLPQQQQQQDPTQNQGQAGSPSDQTSQMEQDSSIFADQVGKTVQKIDFKQKGVGVFDLIIKFAEYDVPLVLSFANGKATVSKPPTGEIYSLT